MKVIYDTKVNVQNAINLFLSYLERSAFAEMSPQIPFYFTIIKGRNQKQAVKTDFLPDQQSAARSLTNSVPAVVN